MKTLVALCLILAAGAAWAEPSPSDARRHFDVGQSLVAQARYADALAEFTAGYELSKKPLFLFNMAECARSAGDRERARTLYAQYLDEDHEGKLASTARARLDELGPPTPLVASAAPAPVVVPPPAPSPPVALPALVAVETMPPPKAKHTGLWIGIAVGAAVLIVGGAVGGYYGATHGANACSGACVSFR